MAARTANALRLALALREPASESKAERRTALASGVAGRLGLPRAERAAVELAASIQGIGRLAIPSALLMKSTPLDHEEWQQMRGHVIAAASLLEKLPELRALAPIVAATHERWDGAGYPLGVAGERIPLPSRIIAACDAYVAMTSDRPFRRALDEGTALQQLGELAGHQFDARVVDALAAELTGQKGARRAHPPRSAEPKPSVARRQEPLLAQLDSVAPVPSLAIARQRLLQLLAEPLPDESASIACIETDPGLVIQVLCSANANGDGRRPATNVPEALSRIGVGALRRVVEAGPTLDFMWPQDAHESVLEKFRLHAVAVQRATLRLAEAIDYPDRDDLAVVALLHDVGRLGLMLIRGDAAEGLAAARTPEQRLRVERRLFGMDHAAIGGILARRWGLPERIATAIGQHHNEEAGRDAQLVCLGDALAHHTQGTSLPPAQLLRLSYALGLAPDRLRAITFELPHLDGSRRSRAEPCPLSRRELDALRGLAEGKVYKQIAEDLGIGSSTVRSHLHHAYTKLGVTDRAQAVLLAIDRGWL